MYSLKKNITVTVIAFFTGAVLSLLTGTLSAERIAEPFILLGNAIRNLSLGSASGNIAAWIILIFLSCLPLAGVLWKRKSKMNILLVLCGVEIFILLYYLVNPGSITIAEGVFSSKIIAPMWAVAAGGCVAGTLICWALLRLLEDIESKSQDILPPLLFSAAAIYALILGYTCFQSILHSMAELIQGNPEESMAGISGIMIVILNLLSVIPGFMGVIVIILAGKLVPALESDPFSSETVALAERISQKTLLLAKVSLFITVLGNGLQLLLFSKLLQVHISINIPLFTLVLCVILILLCKYFRRAKAVNDDNASII